MKIALPLILCVGFLSACTPSTVSAPVEATSANSALHGPGASELLSERDAMYREVFEQAQLQGFLSGALRGLLLGALIDGERGAVFGMAAGAVFGSLYATTAAEQLLEEREEFLNRQQIIENILDASRGAAARSAEDAALVSRAVTEFTSLAPTGESAGEVLGEQIGTLRRAVEMRAVLIEELLHEASLTPEQQAEVRAQIDAQRGSLRVIRAQQDAWRARSDG
ncbi:hypothetical protein [Roseicyclus mahoneyensis]|uniref:Uncharacterized protein n=1 Tax=Roseicyclus mahoneyensis TaxID=164332 RepID=A0A316GM84_9RHOB|nr:hypothetical protein [Roseicyclus mahoneyensis]PWK62277.1 hypothetical protein C7455_101303 [Roseicyclus mahoneyensis]